MCLCVRTSLSNTARARVGWERKLVLFQVNDLSISCEIPERALQFPCLARAQSKLNQQFPQAKCLSGMPFKDFQDFNRRGKLAHQVC